MMETAAYLDLLNTEISQNRQDWKLCRISAAACLLILCLTTVAATTGTPLLLPGAWAALCGIIAAMGLILTIGAGIARQRINNALDELARITHDHTN